MLYATCPVCAESVRLSGIPDRLPVVVPDHRSHDGPHVCPGGGRKSSSVWMTRPEPAGHA